MAVLGEPSRSRSGLDSALAELADRITDRLQAGEPVDLTGLTAEHPEWAETLEGLLPSLLELVELGRSMGGRAAGAPERPAAEGGPAPGPHSRVVGDFRLIREIGRGGMGLVYEAEQVSLGRTVALKILPPTAALDSRAVQRFQLEAQAAAWLNHPHVVPVYAVGVDREVPFYAMQLIEGCSLAEVLRAIRRPGGRADAEEPDAGVSGLVTELLSGRFAPSRAGEFDDRGSGAARNAVGEPSQAESQAAARGARDPQPHLRPSYIRTVARIGVQVAEALQHAHEQGVIHRDIKPGNLLLDHRGHPWVTDFGLARFKGNAGLTVTGDQPGTLRYMSPEQALSPRAVLDGRTDVYSLAVTLYELLGLAPAVEGDDRQEILLNLSERDPRSIRHHNPAVPADLAIILGRAMARQPSARYATAQELADDLGRFLAGRPIAARPIGPISRGLRACTRRPLVAALSAGLLIATALGMAGVAWKWREAIVQRKATATALALAQIKSAEAGAPADRAAAEARRAAAEARRATAQARRADAINRFLTRKLLVMVEPRVSPIPQKMTLLEAVERSVEGIEAAFADQPETEIEIRSALAATFHSLGAYAKAEQVLRAAVDRAAQVYPPDDPRRLEMISQLGHNLEHLFRLDEADALLTPALEIARSRLPMSHKARLILTRDVALVRSGQGRAAEAEALLRSILEQEQAAGDEPVLNRDDTLNELAVMLMHQGRFEEAEPLLREILEGRRPAEDPYWAAHAKMAATNNLAATLRALKRLEPASVLFRDNLASHLEIYGADHPNTLICQSNLSMTLGELGHWDESLALIRRSLESMERTMPDHVDTLMTRHQYAVTLAANGRTEEAVDQFRRSLDHARRLFPPDDPRLIPFATNLERARAIKSPSSPSSLKTQDPSTPKP